MVLLLLLLCKQCYFFLKLNFLSTSHTYYSATHIVHTVSVGPKVHGIR